MYPTGNDEEPHRQPVVSVVINNYNYAHFLADAIESVLAQTYRSIEIIVVDDGSTDNSREVIKSYGSRVKAIYKENGGQASAMNRGYEAASGKLIYFLDADDIALPDCLKKIAHLYESSGDNVAIFQFKLQIIDKKGAVTDGIIPDVEKLQGAEAHRLLRQKGSYVFPPTSGNVFTRKALEKIMPIPKKEYRVCADIYLCTMAALVGEIITTEELLAYYRIHGSNNWATAAHASPGDGVEEYVEMMRSEASVRRQSKKICAAYLKQPIGGNTDLLYLIFNSTRQKLAKNQKSKSNKSRYQMAKQFLSELRQDSSPVPLRNKIAASIYLLTIALLPRSLVYSLVRHVFVSPPKPINLALKKSFGR